MDSHRGLPTIRVIKTNGSSRQPEAQGAKLYWTHIPTIRQDRARLLVPPRAAVWGAQRAADGAQRAADGVETSCRIPAGPADRRAGWVRGLTRCTPNASGLPGIVPVQRVWDVGCPGWASSVSARGLQRVRNPVCWTIETIFPADRKRPTIPPVLSPWRAGLFRFG